MRAFLSSRWYVLVVGVLVCVAHISFGVQAWYGDRFAVVMLTVFATFWTGMAIANGRGWRGSLDLSRETMQHWHNSNEVSQAYGKLLNEALIDLETWDREKAVDIAERARTISMLQLQNLRDREEP